MSKSRARPKKIASYLKNLRYFLLAVFFFLAAFGLKAYDEYQKTVLSFDRPPISAPSQVEVDLPVLIEIPRINLRLPVSPAVAVGDKWDVSEKGASYLLGSGQVGRVGNAVIYGHNKRYIFGPIRWLKKGDLIEIKTQNGKGYLYELIETKVVSPSTVEVLDSTNEPVLTLYTCTGWLDKDRFVVRARLQS